MTWLQQLFEFFGKFRLWFVVAPWEQAIRVRLGRHTSRRGPGFYFKLPLLDAVYVQNTRLRVVNLPNQTVTTRDGKAVTISGTVAFHISDIEKLYRGVQNFEEVVHNLALGAMAKAIQLWKAEDLRPRALEEAATEVLAEGLRAKGVEVENVAITDFALARAYRLIGDQWRSNPQINLAETR